MTTSNVDKAGNSKEKKTLAALKLAMVENERVCPHFLFVLISLCLLSSVSVQLQETIDTLRSLHCRIFISAGNTEDDWIRFLSCANAVWFWQSQCSLTEKLDHTFFSPLHRCILSSRLSGIGGGSLKYSYRLAPLCLPEHDRYKADITSRGRYRPCATPCP